MKRLILLLLILIPFLSFGQDNKIYKNVGGNYIVVGAFKDVGSLWSDKWIVYQKRGSSFVEFGKVESNNLFVKNGNSYNKVMEHITKDYKSYIIRTNESSQRLIGKWHLGIIYAKTGEGNWWTGTEWKEVGKVENGAWSAILCGALLLLYQY